MTSTARTGEEHAADRPRRGVFGEVAELYDAARPGYAPELVPEVLAYADLRGRPAIEFGAGTGKATTPFAAAGIPLRCVEPDARMAEILRRNTAAHPNVRVEVGSFEDWRSEQRYGLLFAATCWHWFVPERRWDIAHGLLAPGGTLALIWNPMGARDARLQAALAEVDRRHDIVDSPHSESVAELDHALADDWSGREGLADDIDGLTERFTDLRARRFREDRRWDTATYLDFLASVSRIRIMADDERASFMTEIADVLDAHGGGVDMIVATDLFLARRR